MSASLPRSSPPSPAESLSSISPTAVIPELWLRPARSHPPPWPWWRGFTPCARNFNLCIRLNASSALPGRSVRPVCWSGVVRRGWNASGLSGSRWRTVIFRRFPFPTPAIPSLRPAKRSRAPHSFCRGAFSRSPEIKSCWGCPQQLSSCQKNVSTVSVSMVRSKGSVPALCPAPGSAKPITVWQHPLARTAFWTRGCFDRVHFTGPV